MGGGGAVTLFFVLSGFVLTVAVQRSDAPTWGDYYPRRILRLYLPVVGAVILASFWITLVPRIAPAGATWWIQGVHEPTAAGIVKDLSLFWEPGSTTSVLWSLTWEVAFSLLLPIYLFVIFRTTRYAGLGIVVSIGLSVLGEWVGSTALTFLPIFAIGCYLATMRNTLPDVVARWWRPRRVWPRFLVVVVLAQAFTLPFLLTGLGRDGKVWVAAGTTAMLMACAATVAIGAVVQTPRSGWAGTSMRWLGSRSFSIYLVHEPIIVSIAIVGAGELSPWWTLPIALPASLIVAEVFFRVVERPVTGVARTFTLPRPAMFKRAVAP